MIVETNREGLTAFARVDALVATFTICLVLCTALGMSSRENARRAGCYNNLRQAGKALQVWANDHEGQFPWFTPVAQGGTKPDLGLKTTAAWIELMSLSNELANPSVLVCPSDAGAKVAFDWSNGPRGLANSGFRANALSYFLSYHGLQVDPRTVVFGDRDLRFSSASGATCGLSSANNTAVAERGNGPSIIWTNALHSRAGTILRVDGSAEYVNSAGLTNALFWPYRDADGFQIHIQPAR